MERTIQELRERQEWTLNQKIDHTVGVLDQFISHCGGKKKVYISVSGKDSCTLLHIARGVFGNDIKAVFCNTGNEYPDIVKHVKTLENCEIIRPKYKIVEIIGKYGFPLVSKDVSQGLRNIKHGSETLRNKRLYGDEKGNGKTSKKWHFLAKKQFDCSEKCCFYLKKQPFEKYEKERGQYGILGILADESRQRTTTWIQYGCNEFDNERILSKPLSIWNESDIWAMIDKDNIPIAEIYHKGAKRTGCMFCGFGCQFEDDNRLEMLLRLYPKYYTIAMNYANNGVIYREALRTVLAVNRLYLPDEQPRTLFDI